MKKLISACALVWACLGANAGTITNTTFLSDIKIDKVASEYDIRGTFYVPAVPAGSAPSFSVTYDIGIAAWNKASAGNTLYALFSGGAGFQVEPSPYWCYCDRFSLGNEVERSSYHAGWGGGFSYILYADELSVDSPYAKDGLVPVQFRLWTDASAYSWPLANPSYIAYLGAIRLKTVTTVNGPDGGNGDIATGPSSGLVWAAAHEGNGGDAVPQELWSQLPSYIPHAISAVPEADTFGMMMMGWVVIGFGNACRRRRAR